ncbi:unnamed protein product [Discosporangium mesarthrocarpum]
MARGTVITTTGVGILLSIWAFCVLRQTGTKKPAARFRVLKGSKTHDLRNGGLEIEFRPIPQDVPVFPKGSHDLPMSTQLAQKEVDKWWATIYHFSPPQTVDLPNILFIKPHKVGSSSMSSLIRMVAARYGGFEREYFFFNSEEYFYGARKRQPIEPGFHIWSDHALLTDILVGAVPEAIDQSFKLTLVREPLDRCLSVFYYYRCTRKGLRWPDLPEEELTQRKLDFPACGDPEFNAFTQMKEIGPAGENSTVEETLAFYDFIAITGRFMESMAVIKMVLGLRYGDMLFFDLKVAGSNHGSFPRPKIDEEPPEVIRHMNQRRCIFCMIFFKVHDALMHSHKPLLCVGLGYSSACLIAHVGTCAAKNASITKGACAAQSVDTAGRWKSGRRALPSVF